MNRMKSVAFFKLVKLTHIIIHIYSYLVISARNISFSLLSEAINSYPIPGFNVIIVGQILNLSNNKRFV